ncbi:MAG: DDE-type integrase/transposase/recombinase [Anaerolineae bacterium]|nr:DDE-type integrase/transposase/recombinase [Anaerolineae bacterium]
MRSAGLVAKGPWRKRPRTTQRAPEAVAAPNLLGQDFTASRPNEKWVADITYIETLEGWLYLALVLDLFSRAIVGWAMADHLRATLVESALQMALGRRTPTATCSTTPTRAASTPAPGCRRCWPSITSRSA